MPIKQEISRAKEMISKIAPIPASDISALSRYLPLIIKRMYSSYQVLILDINSYTRLRSFHCTNVSLLYHWYQFLQLYYL